MPNQGLTAREALSERVRGALLSACGDLLYEQPIEAITINEIVSRAGVAKGSFYNHFADKESLATAVSSEILSMIEERVRAQNENVTDPAYRIIRGMCTHLQLAVADPRRATIMLRGHDWVTEGDHQLYWNVMADISEGISTGRFATRCEDVGALHVIGTGYFSTIRVLEKKLSAQDAIQLATRAFSITLCGFGLEESEARRIVSDSANDIIGNV